MRHGRSTRSGLLLVVFALAFFPVGCDPLGALGIGKQSAPEDFSGEYIQTDRGVYEWDGEELTIDYTYENPFDHTVYIGGCSDGSGPADILEKRVEGEWEVVHSRVCLDVLTKPTEIEPGESYQATFELDKERLQRRQREADSVPGTYRFREPMYWEWDMEKAEDDDLETGTWLSNEFEIR